MPDLYRIAIYVYAKAEVTIAPVLAAVDFMRMADDYGAKFEATVDPSAPATVALYPGVYGYVYEGADHGLTAPPEVVVVTAPHKINPWPKPPPPPPPPFVAARDDEDHCDVFLGPAA